MNTKELENILIKKGLLSNEDAEKVLKEEESTKRSFEEVIYARNLISQEEVAKVKSELLKIPFKKIDVNSIDEGIFKLIPIDNIRTYKMVPMSRTDNLLVVGMVYPDNANAAEALRFLAKRLKVNLGIYIVTLNDINEVLKKFSEVPQEIEAALKSLNIKPGEGLSHLQKIMKLEEGTSKSKIDAPIIRIVSSLLREAVNMEASDIHIEPQRFKTRIRFRLNGDLKEFTTLPAELSQSIISRVKVLSNLKLDETRIPQDGRFRTMIFEKEIDFRVATFPTPAGEKVALRVLDPEIGLKSLDDIGLSGKNAELLTKGIEKPFGMILLTGPTGSGKTTTLYALMRILNKEEVNVLSLEDPVEYTIDGVNQSQVKPEIGYTFISGLRQILRQDPDILMVGEIRDNETAELAVHAALTGHIVLSTLHTNNAVGVIPRLLDMGVSSYLLPSALNLMASQRLLSRLCKKCRKPEDLPTGIASVVKKELAKLPPDISSKYKEPFKIYRAKGCGACRHKGIHGRIAIFEIFEMTHELAGILSSAELNENKILDEARRQGIVSLRQDGIMKALEGLVNIEEVLRETEEL